MRTTEGQAPTASARRTASHPGTDVREAHRSRTSDGRQRDDLSVTRVITPSVPSGADEELGQLGPTACRGTSTVSITSPPASATRIDRTRSSIFP